ncbi:MAG: hypothetical protein GF329_22510 [Candidatus Lokiarchaeota archaeon]|nr:hypothetical protein [Candidatus Lokiarchaeota archaeon]
MPQNRGILGHVNFSDETAAEGIKITVTEKDLLFDDKLPITWTDKDGNFIVTYNPDRYSIKGPLQERPDIEILLEYKKEGIPKKFRLFYKDVEKEWLTIESINLEDPPDICEPIVEDEIIYHNEQFFTINLKESIDISDPLNNDIWEVYVGDILEFSSESIIPDKTPLKKNSWGGIGVVGDVINEGSISKEEKQLTVKGFESLNKREGKFDDITLLFEWLDRDGNIIHDSIYNKSNDNFIKINDVSIFIPKPTSKTSEPDFLPVDRLELRCRVVIKGVINEFKILSMDSIQNLIL